MHYKIENGELWVLVRIYIGPIGLVAHWFNSHVGHKTELLKVKFKPARRK